MARRSRLTCRTRSDAEALDAQKLNAEVGTKIAEARRLLETDPEKGIAILREPWRWSRPPRSTRRSPGP